MQKFLKNWWLVLAKGIFAIIFGLIALFYPDITLYTLITFFGLFAIAGGLFLAVASVINAKHNAYWGFWLTEGLLDILIGIVIIAYPEITIKIFIIIFGVWALISGVMHLINARKLRGVLINKNVHIINGVIAVLFGILLLFNPFGGGIALTMLIGIFALIYGIFSVIIAVRLGKISQ